MGGVFEAAEASGSSGPSETTSEGYKEVQPSEHRAKLLVLFPQSLTLKYFAEATLRRQAYYLWVESASWIALRDKTSILHSAI